MKTLATAFRLLVFLITSIIAISLLIALEIFCVGVADAHLQLRGINISWILWILCVLVVCWEIFSFCVNVIWKQIVIKFMDLFSLK
tara:strand:- start:1646 stop:1903 length:258 start_codon:yes stop_codon:yes gene_type:complete